MPPFAERLKTNLINWIGGESYRRSQSHLVGLIDRIYRYGPALVPTQTLLQQLGEVDGRLIDLMLRTQTGQVVAGQPFGFGRKMRESDRLRVVHLSRIQYDADGQYESAVSMWTDFGFGQKVEIMPNDDTAREIWNECWKSRRNSPLFKQRRLHKISEELLIDGEVFFVAYASRIDGKVRWRKFATDEVTDVIYESGDSDIALWYKVKTSAGAIYFPDWQASDKQLNEGWQKIHDDDKDARRADELSGTIEIGGETTRSTDCRVVHAAIDERNGRGWPKFYRAIPWSDALRDHIGDHITVARSRATYVDKLRVKSGSRGVSAIASKFRTTAAGSSGYTDTNPPPAAGSMFASNDAVDLERLPMATGASDAQITTGLLVSMLSNCTKIPPHWSGFPQIAQNRATAKESNRPFVEQMQRYQKFLADVFQDLVEVTLMFASEYGKHRGADFSEVESSVTFESPEIADLPAIAVAIKTIGDGLGNGTIEAAEGERALKWLVRLYLVTLGARDVESIVGEPEGSAEEGPEGGPDVPPEVQGTMEGAVLLSAKMYAAGQIGFNDLMEYLHEVAEDGKE